MNRKWKFSTLALAALMTLTAANAQQNDKKEKDKKKHQTITIVRTGDAEEKITVEVTGDKVTVNGKPLEEYKGEDIRVITAESDEFRIMTPGRIWAGPKAPRAPMAIAGGHGDKFFSWGNEARLGVTTENAEGGARVTEVSKESAAEKAGLKEGDILTKLGETAITDATDVVKAIAKKKPEESVSITYKRDGKEATTAATLQKNNEPFAGVYSLNRDFDQDFNFQFNTNGSVGRAFTSNRKPRLGLQVEDLEEGNGVKVLDASAETPAGKAGLQKDDVIVSFNGKEIKTVDDLRDSMKDVKPGDLIKVTYRRAGANQNAEIRLPKPVKKASL